MIPVVFIVLFFIITQFPIFGSSSETENSNLDEVAEVIIPQTRAMFDVNQEKRVSKLCLVGGGIAGFFL